MQNCGMAPPFVTWFQHKNGGRRPFFWPSRIFGQENGLGFGLENFHSGLHYSQILWPPPPFENPAYATDVKLIFFHMSTLLALFFV